jgi:hypothetical protein
MIKIPRSLAIAQPYRGRTIRSIIRSKVPGGRILFDAYWRKKGDRVNRKGRKVLALGKPEGRRFMTAIPHPFCGIGHSHSEWHAAFQWAPLLDLEFVHIPLKVHWDKFFGLENLPRYKAIIREFNPIILRVPYAAWSRGADAFPAIRSFIEGVRSDRNLLFVLADGQNAYDHITHAGAFKTLFESKGDWQHLPLHKEAGKVNVAVHLRRGDVAQMAAAKSSNWNERYVPEEWFVGVMDELRTQFAGSDRVFHIYSQGTEEDFPLTRNRPDIMFHLDAGEEETLLNMAKADVLVMSPSGFSYLAAMLSEGLKVARYPWWHWIPEGNNWFRLCNECAI